MGIALGMRGDGATAGDLRRHLRQPARDIRRRDREGRIGVPRLRAALRDGEPAGESGTPAMGRRLEARDPGQVGHPLPKCSDRTGPPRLRADSIDPPLTRRARPLSPPPIGNTSDVRLDLAALTTRATFGR